MQTQSFSRMRVTEETEYIFRLEAKKDTQICDFRIDTKKNEVIVKKQGAYVSLLHYPLTIVNLLFMTMILLPTDDC